MCTLKVGAFVTASNLLFGGGGAEGGSVSINLTQCGRVTQICVFNTVKLGTSASSP